MAARTISLDDEAYALLRAAKIGDESFSDVVKRTFAVGRPRLAALAGALSSEDAAAVAKSVQKLRARSRTAAAGRRARLWK